MDAPAQVNSFRASQIAKIEKTLRQVRGSFSIVAVEPKKGTIHEYHFDPELGALLSEESFQTALSFAKQIRKTSERRTIQITQRSERYGASYPASDH